MTGPNGIVSGMVDTPKRLREAKTRDGMRALTLWIPERMHRTLALLRVNEGIAINEAIRLAIAEWLKNRRGKKP